MAEPLDAAKLVARGRSRVGLGQPVRSGQSIDTLVTAAQERAKGVKRDSARVEGMIASARAQFRASRTGS